MKYIRRLVGFLAARMLIITVLLGVITCGFYMCLNTANIYIVVADGMEKRVDVILTREDAPSLNNYFHGEFLTADPALASAFDGTSPYIDYKISAYEYSLDIESLWAWPWDNYATCTVVERVPSISGTVVASRQNEVSAALPSWQGGRYELTLAKSGGKWKIVGMKQRSIIVETTPEPTAEPTASPEE